MEIEDRRSPRITVFGVSKHTTVVELDLPTDLTVRDSHPHQYKLSMPLV